jgi:hypothetical protein
VPELKIAALSGECRFIARFGLVLTTGVTFWFSGHHHGREQKVPTESPRRWY